MSRKGYGYNTTSEPRDFAVGTARRKKTQAQIAEEMQEINSLPIKGYAPRKISKETMEFFGVRTEVNQQDGVTPSVHWYPYNIVDGVPKGWKSRTLPKDFEARGCIGKIKGFFGQDKVVGRNLLVIVEGEQDALAGREIMLRTLDRSPYNIVSIPTGTHEDGVLHEIVKREIEWLQEFKKIIICFDSDKPGQATAKELADYLCADVEVETMALPLNDTAAMLEQGREREWLTCLNRAKRHVSDQIVAGSDCDFERLLTPLKEGIHIECIPRTSARLRGFRTREMTTLIAPPKCGKSSLLRYMVYQILRDTNESVGGFFLEETTDKTRQSLLAHHAGVALNLFRQNPSIADRHKLEEARDLFFPRLHLFDHNRKVITDDLLERKIDFLVKGMGCKTIILDHTTFVVGTRQTNNERRDIDMMLTRLARSVEDNDYRLLLVAHISRKGREQTKLEQGKKYPYWEILSMDDARGSGAYEQCSHNMIALEKEHTDPEGSNTRGRIRTRILVSREWGEEGIGDYLRFGEDGKFAPCLAEF